MLVHSLFYLEYFTAIGALIIIERHKDVYYTLNLNDFPVHCTLISGEFNQAAELLLYEERLAQSRAVGRHEFGRFMLKQVCKAP